MLGFLSVYLGEEIALQHGECRMIFIHDGISGLFSRWFLSGNHCLYLRPRLKDFMLVASMIWNFIVEWVFCN